MGHKKIRCTLSKLFYIIQKTYRLSNYLNYSLHYSQFVFFFCRLMSSCVAIKEIFISYGREPEVIEFVKKLKNDLEQSKFTAWLDLDDIPAGSDWHGAIGTGLHNCRALVAVITNKYLNSRYCSSELYTADGDRKRIYPVLLEDVDFGASETARGVKYVISGINWTMFRPRVDDYATSLGRLVQGLRGMKFETIVGIILLHIKVVLEN